jgi:hypothetical protein
MDNNKVDGPIISFTGRWCKRCECLQLVDDQNPLQFSELEKYCKKEIESENECLIETIKKEVQL